MNSIVQVKADWKAKGLDWSRWVRTENDERAALAGCIVKPAYGQHVVDYAARYCKHFKGVWAGKPFIFDPWQIDDIIMPLFSWVKPEGTRRFNKAEIWIPKKNGKSAMASVIGLYLLRADGEPGAEVYCAAVDRAQAGIVFGEAANMVAASPALSSKFEVIRSTKTIMNGTASWMRALSAEVPTKEGLNASAVIVDELHAHKSRELFTTLMYSGRARRNFMMIVISTAGEDKESIGGEEYEYAKGVLSGTVEDTRTFAYVREADAKDDWTSPAVWRKANPAMGIIFQEKDMRLDCEEAKQSPPKQADFKRYLLNMWVDSANPWLDMGAWDASGAEEIEDSDLIGLPCCGGLDLSSTTDLSAFVLAFPGDGRFKLKCWFWMPEEGIARKELRDRSQYRLWADRGLLTLTPGTRIDYAFIRQTIKEAAALYSVQEIAFDPYNATQIVGQLKDDDGVNMVEMRQGYLSMSDACKQFHADHLSGGILHGGNAVLRWMASHVVIRRDPADNWKCDKEKSRHRIDGIVSAVMATYRARLMAQSYTSLFVPL